MKKIMFNDRYGLTQAVLEGRKTMTRRIIKGDYVAVVHLKYEGSFIGKTVEGDSVILPQPTYKIGEKVAVAQSYASILCRMGVVYKRTDNGSIQVQNSNDTDFTAGDIIIDGTKIPKEYNGVGIQAIHTKKKILDNKMFVRSDLMPHVIEITDIKAERLQDISDEDCRKEGIIPVTWRQYPEPFSDHYVDHDLWTLEKYRKQFEDAWSDDDPEAWAATSPKTAFAVLIRKLQGKKAWERNEWQFVYTFKLIK